MRTDNLVPEGESSTFIEYKSGYHHVLHREVVFQTTIYPPKDIVTEFVELTTTGRLAVRRRFAWDGASGPVHDTKKNARASLGHDALYWLIRAGLLAVEWRKPADQHFEKWLIEDGVWPWLARLRRKVLERWGGRAASPENRKKITRAP